MTARPRHSTSRLLAGALVAAAFLAAAAAATPATAQLGRKSWEFFPHAGVLLPGDPVFFEGDEDFDFEPQFLWGFYATYHYTDYVGVELGYTKASADHAELQPGVSGLPADVGLDLWQLNGFVNSGALKRLQLFATAGGGVASLDPEDGEDETRFLVNGGAGVRYYAWKNIALRGEVKDFVVVDSKRGDYTNSFGLLECPRTISCTPADASDDAVHNIGLFAGISFNF